VVYLREHDPEEFLDDPVLAPLAVLARGSRKQREAVLGAALRLIRDSGHPRTAELLQIAETLATIRLDLPTIERIRKENGMSVQPLVDFWRDSEIGEQLQALGHQKGRKEGRHEGRQEGRREGRDEGRAGVLLALLRVRFAGQPGLKAVAERLATWSDQAASEAIIAATDPAELLKIEPPA
jgi:hypothetical protein